MLKRLNINRVGQGPALVFFHGWGFDSQIWQPLIPKLALDHQIYLVDLPGFGASEYMEWPSFKANLLSQLPEQFTAVGWSLGGLLALKLASEEPQRFLRLLSVASSPRFIEDDDWPGVKRDVFDHFHRNLSKNPLQVRQQFVQLQTRGQWIDKDSHMKMPSTEGLQAGLHSLYTLDLREELKQLSMPVCFMFGRLDSIVSVDIYRKMRVEYPHCQYQLFPKAAHMPFLSHQAEFLDYLREFVA